MIRRGWRTTKMRRSSRSKQVVCTCRSVSVRPGYQPTYVVFGRVFGTHRLWRRILAPLGGGLLCSTASRPSYDGLDEGRSSTLVRLRRTREESSRLVACGAIPQYSRFARESTDSRSARQDLALLDVFSLRSTPAARPATYQLPRHIPPLIIRHLPTHGITIMRSQKRNIPVTLVTQLCVAVTCCCATLVLVVGLRWMCEDAAGSGARDRGEEERDEETHDGSVVVDLWSWLW